jgi:hypothetical protein
LLPRSHGECGWAKNTGSPVAVIDAWRAISAPQSQVSDRRIGAVRAAVPGARSVAGSVPSPGQIPAGRTPIGRSVRLWLALLGGVAAMIGVGVADDSW